jgi:hypothetical protein
MNNKIAVQVLLGLTTLASREEFACGESKLDDVNTTLTPVYHAILHTGHSGIGEPMP